MVIAFRGLALLKRRKIFLNLSYSEVFQIFVNIFDGMFLHEVI